MSLLSVRDLSTHFFTREGVVHAVDGVSFDVEERKVLGIVGESGCGKTVTALSVIGLIQKPVARIVSGEVLFGGRDLTKLSERELEDVRGSQIAMIFQDPMTSLNPSLTIGTQITETIRRHFDVSKEEARRRAVALLDELRQSHGTSMMLITHDMGVIAEAADDVVVMYAGQIVEQAPVNDLFDRPEHPYTEALLGALPQIEGEGIREGRLTAIPGRPPDLIDPPQACRFGPRCPYASGNDSCTTVMPELREIRPGHFVRSAHPTSERAGTRVEVRA